MRAPSVVLTLGQPAAETTVQKVAPRQLAQPSETTLRKLGGKRRRKLPALKNPLLNDF